MDRKQCVCCKQVQSLNEFKKIQSQSTYTKTCIPCLDKRYKKARKQPVYTGGTIEILERKQCAMCKEEKSLSYFHRSSKSEDGYNWSCAPCCGKRKAELKVTKKDRDKLVEQNMKVCKGCKETKPIEDYYSEPKGAQGRKGKCKSCVDKVKQDYYQRVEKNCVRYRVEANCRRRVLGALSRYRNGAAVKCTNTFNLLGCDIDFLMKHLASQFTEGMTWENYGKWHIDHIRPCAAFNLIEPDEQAKCFHYTNLQPLWAIDNMKKGAKTSQLPTT